MPRCVHRCTALMLVAVAALLVASVLAVADPSYPRFTAPVVDAAGVLSDSDKTAIIDQVLDLQSKSNIQFAIATVPSLDGEEIEPYANGLFRDWKLGQKGVDNGLLLLVAPNERKLRFEVGYGLEGVMTDLQAKLIIANTMVPKLKAGDTAGAITAGVADAITVLTTDKANWPRRLRQPKEDEEPTTDVIVACVVIFFLIVIVAMSSRQRRRGSGGGPWVAGSGIGAANDSFSDSGSSSGGDSFSGGGGGDSGGGGASGSW